MTDRRSNSFRRAASRASAVCLGAGFAVALTVGTALPASAEREAANVDGNSSSSVQSAQAAPPAEGDPQIGDAISVTRGEPTGRPAEVAGVLVVPEGAPAPAGGDPRPVTVRSNAARSGSAPSTTAQAGGAQLARTGLPNGPLALFALALIALGVGLVHHSSPATSRLHVLHAASR